jgi:hypothetical protein
MSPLRPAALVIDGRCLFDRAFHATRRSWELEDLPSHIVTAGAAIASLGTLLGPGGKLPEPPTHVLVCWDGTRAKSAKPRPEKLEDHAGDLDFWRELLPKLIGGSEYCPPDGSFGESDDAVSTAVDRYGKQFSFCVLSSDKDLQQLAREASYYHLEKQVEITEVDIQRKWGACRPSHIALWLALRGDPGDGIDGVDKIGEKKATELVSAVGDVSLREAVDQITPLLNEAQQNQFMECLELTVLRRDLPDVPPPGKIKLGGFPVLDAAGITGTGRQVWGRLLGRVASG